MASNIFIKARPTTKPPIWAQKATPPTFLGVRPAENNWMRSQNPRKIKAGISTNWKKKKIGINVKILERG
jgi:hypothetical protein